MNEKSQKNFLKSLLGKITIEGPVRLRWVIDIETVGKAVNLHSSFFYFRPHISYQSSPSIPASGRMDL